VAYNRVVYTCRVCRSDTAVPCGSEMSINIQVIKYTTKDISETYVPEMLVKTRLGVLETLVLFSKHLEIQFSKSRS